MKNRSLDLFFQASKLDPHFAKKHRFLTELKRKMIPEITPKKQAKINCKQQASTKQAKSKQKAITTTTTTTITSYRADPLLS